MKRGLGKQAPAVLARPRRAPGVLSRSTAEVDPSLTARVVEMSRKLGQMTTDRRELLAALADALDGWESNASTDEAARIDVMRKRWGLTTDRLTDGAGES